LGAPAGQVDGSSAPLYSSHPAQNLLLPDGLIAAAGGIAPQLEFQGLAPRSVGRWDALTIHLEDTMGRDAPLEAAQDNLSRSDIGGNHRLHGNDLFVPDDRDHARPAGPETHGVATTQKLGRQIGKVSGIEP
jgi:hypothetical protein